MSRRYITLSIALSGIATLAIQLTGLLTLPVRDYGLFSIIYLVNAFALSIQLSFLCEAWGRSLNAGSGARESHYNSVGFYLAVISGSVSLGITLFVPDLKPVWWLSFIAVAATVYRAGIRYFALHRSKWRTVLIGDAVQASVGLLGGLLIFLTSAGTLYSLMILWASASVASAAVTFRIPLGRPRIVAQWYRSNKTNIKMLLKDSLILDASSIGTPYALLPIIGLTNFGIYRAVSNVSAPVRLVLNPLRARVAHFGPTRVAGYKTVAALCGLSIAVGACASICLQVVHWLDWNLGTLTELVDFAIPVGLFVAANMLCHFYYMFARNFANNRSLMLGRVNQTLLTGLSPILGAILSGLQGAIWLYAISTAISALIWIAVARRRI